MARNHLDHPSRPPNQVDPKKEGKRKKKGIQKANLITFVYLLQSLGRKDTSTWYIRNPLGSKGRERKIYPRDLILTGLQGF